MNTPTVEQPIEQFPCGDYRSWRILVPGVDGRAGGFKGVWTLGTPTDPEDVEMLEQAAAPPAIVVYKSTDNGTLSVLPVPDGSGTYLWFTLLKPDTLSLPPRFYVGQGWLLDPAGNPVTVTRGLVNLTPSLLPVPHP